MNNKKKNRVDIITTPTKLHQLRAELQKYKSQLEKKKSEGKERETDRINRNIAKTELRIKERKEKLLQLLAQDSNQNIIEIERELDSEHRKHIESTIRSHYPTNTRKNSSFI